MTIKKDKDWAMSLGADCHNCPLLFNDFIPSHGPRDAQRVVLEFKPTVLDFKNNKLFSGTRGHYTETILEAGGTPKEEVLFTNTILCKVRDTTAIERAVKCCEPRLRHEIELRDVLVCNVESREPLLPHFDGQAIRNVRGSWHWSNTFECNVLQTYSFDYITTSGMNFMKDVLTDYEKFCLPGMISVPEVEYEIIYTHDRLRVVVELLLMENKPLCFDLETSNPDMENTDVNPNTWWNSYLLCMGLGVNPEQVYIIPEELLNSKKTLNIIKPLFFNEGNGVYGHNVKFDITRMMNYYKLIGSPLEKWYICDDTMLMHSLLDERSGGHGLKPLVGHYFNVHMYDEVLHKYLKRPKKDSYAKIPRPVLYKYCAQDIGFTIRLRTVLNEELEEENLYTRPYRLTVVPMYNNVIQMEYNGLQIDVDELNELADFLQSAINPILAEIHELGEEAGLLALNPNSPQQMAKYYYDYLGLPQVKGKGVVIRGSGKIVRKKWKEKFLDVPMFKLHNEFRRLAKLLGTYATKIPQIVQPNGRVSYDFKMNGTVTGRVTASLLLTMPRKNKEDPIGSRIRKSFIVRPGRIMLAADAAQAELRWGGFLSGDPFLHKVYKDDRDLHTEAVLELFGSDWNSEQRMITKMLNFSFLYGGNEGSLSDAFDMKIDIARAIIRNYQVMMGGVVKWKVQVENQAKRDGFLTSPVGRRRRFPLINHKNWYKLKNEIVNFEVQSTSSDSTLWAMAQSTEYFKKRKMDCFPINFLHDGTYFSCLDDKYLIEDCMRNIHSTMIDTAYYIMHNCGTWFPEFEGLEPIPFKVDLETGPSWGELSHYEVPV